MSLIINLRHLENRSLALRGKLSVTELELDTRDEMMRATQPVQYDLEVQLLDGALLVQGRLEATLECECVRCLKPFTQQVKIDPWAQHLPLEGEEAVSVDNDCVDLTPFVREDILLEFPQHPLCKSDCAGLKKAGVGKALETDGKVGQPTESAWAKLNKLKL
jgi:uncharacterized protein